MKKICFAFNHLDFSDGIARSVISMANYLNRNSQVQITLRPIYKHNNRIDTLIDENIRIKPVFGFYFRGFSKIVNILPIRFLHKIIFNEYFDIEVGFQNGTSTKAVSYRKKKNNLRYVWIHGYDDKLSMLPYLKKVDKIICVSKQNATKLNFQTNNMLPVDYNYNSFDESYIINMSHEQVLDYSFNSRRITFITVGRISKEKGFKRLIEACVELIDRGYIFNLLIIGDGEEKSELNRIINENRAEKFIYLLGKKENPYKYIVKSDLFICSSFSEGFSTACLESIILGVPVLSTDVSGAKELIEEAQSGMVIENRKESIVDGIKLVLDNQELLLNWKKVLNKTKKKFNYKERSKKLLSIFEFNK